MSALTFLDQWRCQSCGHALGRPNAACADATWHLPRRSEREARARLLALGAEGAWRAWEALTPPHPAPAPAEPSGADLRALIEVSGRSQQALARALELDPRTIRRYLRARRIPRHIYLAARAILAP